MKVVNFQYDLKIIYYFLVVHSLVIPLWVDEELKLNHENMPHHTPTT